jgi:type VI secretion system protein ImpA
LSGPLDQQTLLEPISVDQPCGVDLDDTGLLVTLDGLRLFGQNWSPEAPLQLDGQSPEGAKVKSPPDWNQLRAMTLEALGKSKDLRLLNYLGTAVLRTDGLAGFVQVLDAASQWLNDYWVQVHPVIDEDALARLNALNCLADPMAVVDRVRRVPLVESRRHGKFSLRDVEAAAGQVALGPTETRPDEAAVQSAFSEMEADKLRELEQVATSAIAALNRIDEKMRSAAGIEFAPNFTPLRVQFSKLVHVCHEQLAKRSSVDGGASDEPAAAQTGSQPGSVGGPIKSRQDAIRALDSVADFFRRHEPSSPIPLIVDRAKRLVSKDFLEVLADIAPDAVATARSAAGLKDQVDVQQQ